MQFKYFILNIVFLSNMMRDRGSVLRKYNNLYKNIIQNLAFQTKMLKIILMCGVLVEMSYGAPNYQTRLSQVN